MRTVGAINKASKQSSGGSCPIHRESDTLVRHNKIYCRLLVFLHMDQFKQKPPKFYKQSILSTNPKSGSQDVMRNQCFKTLPTIGSNSIIIFRTPKREVTLIKLLIHLSITSKRNTHKNIYSQSIFK